MKDRTIREQWERERAIWPGGLCFDDYCRFVASHPTIFGRGGTRGGAAWHLVEQARAEVLRCIGPAQTRWEPIEKTSPSGKTLMRCRGCGVESPIPLAECRAAWRRSGPPTCTDEIVRARDLGWTYSKNTQPASGGWAPSPAAAP